jgi:hypothetical protein
VRIADFWLALRASFLIRCRFFFFEDCMFAIGKGANLAGAGGACQELPLKTPKEYLRILA